MRPLLSFGVLTALLLSVITIGRFPVSIAGPDASPALASAQLSLPGLAANAPLDVPDEIVAAPVPLTLYAPQVTEEAIVAAADTTFATTSALEEELAAGSNDLGLSLTGTNPDRTSLFFEYTVAAGDTLSSIASRYGVGVEYVQWNNADITSDPSSLQINEVLQIPSVEGILYDVRVGDTLHDIATTYGAEVDDMINFGPNGLTDPNDLREGALLLVVGGVRPVPRIGTVVNPDGDPTGWRWPTIGVITSVLDAGHPLGIDIGVPLWTAITATRAGTVSFVGGDPRFSYGYNVRIDHGSGYESRYAHLSGFEVVPGQWVEAGETIGWSGNTGRSTGPHLHFEINRYSQTLDPIALLPGR
jgi:murein DD-endopeptidase MepM/ murein hydrolase activator NlpD